jgi:hypothetical protein
MLGSVKLKSKLNEASEYQQAAIRSDADPFCVARTSLVDGTHV